MRKYNIGVLIGNTHTNVPKELLHGISEEARGEPVNIIFFLGMESSYFYKNMLVDETTDNYDYQYDTIYDYANMADLDALIIAYGCLEIFLKESKAEFLNRFSGIPYVILEDEAENGKGTSIIVDNYNGMKSMVKHLICIHGCQKILYLSGPEGNMEAIERKQAYLDALSECGLAVSESQIAYGNYSEYVDAQVNALLDANPGADALVCANDEMAISCYRVCKKRGLKVGKDIAVTGFDDIETARFMDPPLTTIVQDGYKIGRDAVKRAVQICAGTIPPSERTDTVIQKRASCGCEKDPPAGQDKIRSERGLKRQLEQLTQFQRSSWFVPSLALNLMQTVDRPALFYAKIVRYLKAMDIGSFYLYLLNDPIIHRSGDPWKCPGTMRLAAYCDETGQQAYEPDERPVIRTFTQLEKAYACCSYIAFTLFSGERLYGVIFCEITPDQIDSMYLTALQLGNSIRFLEVSLAERTAKKQLQQKNEVLSFISEKDELTKLYNRRGLMERMIAFNQKNPGKRVCLIFVDLDHLKEINDSFGHSEGDYAIRTASRLLREILGTQGIIGRIGGDEFTGLIPEISKKDIGDIGRRIKAACEKHNECSGKPYYVELSVGVTELVCGENIDFSDLINRTDALMYTAKKSRRPSVKR